MGTPDVPWSSPRPLSGSTLLRPLSDSSLCQPWAHVSLLVIHSHSLTCSFHVHQVNSLTINWWRVLVCFGFLFVETLCAESELAILLSSRHTIFISICGALFISLFFPSLCPIPSLIFSFYHCCDSVSCQSIFLFTSRPSIGIIGIVLCVLF